MKSLKIIFGVFVLLALTAAGSFGQQELTLVTTNENTKYGNRVEINVPELSGNPRAIFVVTPLGETEEINTQPMGAWYYNDKWNLSNTDGTRIVPGLRYKIQYFPKPGANHYLHIISKENLGDEGSYLDHPGLNNNPNAQFKILQNHAPDNRPAYNLNRYEARAFYNSASGKWYLKNVKGERLTVNTAYNIVVFSGGAVASNTPQPSPTPAAIASKTPTLTVSAATKKPAASAPTTKQPTTDAIPLTFGNLNDFAEKGLPAPNALPTGNLDQAAAAMARQIAKADEQSLPVLLMALQMAGFTVIDENGKVLLKPADGKGQGLGFYDFEAVGSQKLANRGIIVSLEKIAGTIVKDLPQISSSQLAESLLKDLRAQAESSNDPSLRFYARLIVELGKSSAQPFDLMTAPASLVNLSVLQASLLLRRLQGDLYTLKNKRTGTIQTPFSRRNMFVSAKWGKDELSFFVPVSAAMTQKPPCNLTGDEALILDAAAVVTTTGQGKWMELLDLGKIAKGVEILNIALSWGKLVAAVTMLRGELTVDNPPLIRTKNSVPGNKRLMTAKVRSEVGKKELLNCLRPAINIVTGLDFNLPTDGPLADTFIEWQFDGANDTNLASKKFVFFEPMPGADPKPNKQITDQNGISKMYLVGSPKVPAVAYLKNPLKVEKKAKVLVAVTLKSSKDFVQNWIDIGGIALGLAVGGPGPGLFGAVAEIGFRLPYVVARATVPVIDHEPCDGRWWTLDYTVTVKGSGRGEATASGNPEIIWRIDRSYSASVGLNDRNINLSPEEAVNMTKMTPQMMAEFVKAERKLRFANTKDALLDIHIDDKIERITKEVCGDNTDETTSNIEMLKADGEYPTPHGESLLTDNQLLTYNIWIPVGSGDRNSKAMLFRQTKYQRSGGGTPSKADTNAGGTPTDIPGLPSILGVIKSGLVTHLPERPLPADFPMTDWEFDSGEVMPDEPLINNVPDSKTNVKIRVYYRLTRGCR